MAKVNLVLEFEKRYKGNPADGEKICREIAQKFGLDEEYVIDYVYIHRYENEESDNDLAEEIFREEMWED